MTRKNNQVEHLTPQHDWKMFDLIWMIISWLSWLVHVVLPARTNHTSFHLYVDREAHFHASLHVRPEEKENLMRSTTPVLLYSLFLSSSPCHALTNGQQWKGAKKGCTSWLSTGRLVVRCTKSLMVPNRGWAVGSTQPSGHEDSRPRTGRPWETVRLTCGQHDSQGARGCEKRVRKEVKGK